MLVSACSNSRKSWEITTHRVKIRTATSFHFYYKSAETKGYLAGGSIKRLMNGGTINGFKYFQSLVVHRHFRIYFFGLGVVNFLHEYTKMFVQFKITLYDFWRHRNNRFFSCGFLQQGFVLRIRHLVLVV